MAKLIVPLSITINGAPTNADTTPTITIVDNTTSTTVVTNAPGALLSTGQYSYTYASASPGHTYTSTWTSVVAALTYTEPIITFVPLNPLAPAGTPIAASTDMVDVLQEQLGYIAQAKIAALGAISAVLLSGTPGGISYSISGKVGAESVSFTEFLTAMREQVKSFTELEIEVLKALQSLQPFNIVVPVVVSPWGAC